MMRQFSTATVFVGRKCDPGQIDYEVNRDRQYDLTCSPRGCVAANRIAATKVPDGTAIDSSATPRGWEQVMSWLVVVAMTAFALSFLYFAFQTLTVGLDELESIQSASVSRNLP